MDKHITPIDRSKWVFEFDNSKRFLGKCYQPTIFNPGRIQVTTGYAQKAALDDVQDTLLHEIAHAITGPGHHHDKYWKRNCVLIGAKPDRCADSDAFEEYQAESANYVATCPSCNSKYYASKMGKNMRNNRLHCHVCVKTQGFNDNNKLTYRRNA